VIFPSFPRKKGPSRKTSKKGKKGRSCSPSCRQKKKEGRIFLRALGKNQRKCLRKRGKQPCNLVKGRGFYLEKAGMKEKKKGGKRRGRPRHHRGEKKKTGSVTGLKRAENERKKKKKKTKGTPGSPPWPERRKKKRPGRYP